MADTIRKLEKRYPEEWLLVEVTKEDAWVIRWRGD